MAIKFRKKLLVEGNDDKHVVLALCAKFEIHQNFEIIDCQGIDKLIEQIPARLKESEIETLGLVIDADTNLANRWNSLKQLLKDQGFNMPEELPESGLCLITDSQITIGIWIMPNNSLNGMLEDFISFLVPSDDSLLPIVKEHLQSIESKNLNKYKPCHKSKAVIHSWLALQEEPGTPLGLSITKRYLTTNDEICLKFIDWLRRLFK